MRVAIIGAGPCGLACALELERHGITPDIFERGDRVGSAIPYVALMLQVFERPTRDQVEYLNKKLELPFKPLARLKRLVMRTRHHTAGVRGDLGYLLERGQGSQSLEVQLSKKLSGRIKFDIQADYRSLAGEYDYVVVADGSPLAARDLGIWETTVSAWAKGAVILGQFDPKSATIFFDTGYARHGYAYLTPFSCERANLMLIVPDSNRTELSEYWDLFLERESIEPETVETFDLHHVTGLSLHQQVNNILLVGSSGGFTDSFIGLGLFTGMASGVLAARAIAKGLDYERMAHPLINQVRRMLDFREAFNTLDNNGIDLLVRTITLPGIKQIIYNSHMDFISFIHPLLKARLNKRR